jgi:hypothetical protein
MLVLLLSGVGPSKKKRKRSPAQCQPKNAVCALNELRPGLTYNTVSMTGPVHAPLFTISVEVGLSHKTFYYYYYYYYYYYLIELQMGGSGTTIKHNTQIHISHNLSHHARNTAHKAVQTIKDTLHTINTKLKTPWPESVSELYRPRDRRFSAKLVPTFADRGCHTVSVTDPYGHIRGFLDWSRYFFFQIASQLCSRG